MKSCFFAADPRVVVQHVVEVPDVARGRYGGVLSAAFTRFARSLSKGLRRSRVLATGSSMASAGMSDFDGMEGGRELDVVGAQLSSEGHPLLDGPVGVRVADFAGGELLEGGGEHAHLHELGREGLHGHRGSSLDPQPALDVAGGGRYLPVGRPSTAEGTGLRVRFATQGPQPG